MTKVYIVTSGCYSQYGIDRVFSTRERAEAWIHHVDSHDGQRATPERSDDSRDIEEFDLDEPSQPFASAWVATIDDDGEFHRITAEHPFFGQFLGKPDNVFGTGSHLPYWSYSHFATDPPEVEIDSWGWRTFVGYGKSPEHARRSAEELRRQTLALEGKVIA